MIDPPGYLRPNAGDPTSDPPWTVTGLSVSDPPPNRDRGPYPDRSRGDNGTARPDIPQSTTTVNKSASLTRPDTNVTALPSAVHVGRVSRPG